MISDARETQRVCLEEDDRESANAAANGGENASTAFLGSPARPKVMMVDDDKLNSFVIAEYLKSDGYRDLVYTTDPFAAQSLGRHVLPGLILLDLLMPERGGLDVLRRLRADDAFDQTAIVILTASHDDKLRRGPWNWVRPTSFTKGSTAPVCWPACGRS